MERALQNYQRATMETANELLAAWETEREKLTRKQRDLEEARRRLELEASEGRRALEKDRAAFAAEIAGVEGMVVRPEDRVQLNIGGRHFETTRQTLTAALKVAPYSYFGAMFSGRHEGRMQRDGEGRIYIDRSGSIFELILEFLRRYKSGDKNAAFGIHALPETQMEAMRVELDYYGLESAVFPPVPFSVDAAIFSPGPDMLLKREELGAVVLPENRGILVVGGRDDDGEVLASTELFDLETETFSHGPEMESRRMGCAVATLEDGRVVAVGGYGYDGRTLSTTEVLSPASNTWSPGPNLASARFGSAALPLGSSRVLVIGGGDYFDEPFLSTTEVVDLASGTSTPGPVMSCPRESCAAVMLHDGRVLVIGGENGDDGFISTTEVLDLTSDTSSPGPEMNTARVSASAVLLPEDDGVLVIGGGCFDDEIDFVALATTEVLDVAGNSTSAGPELGIPRTRCTAVKLPGDRILVIGGNIDDTPSSTSEILGMPA